LEDLDDYDYFDCDMVITRAWENFKENRKVSATESLGYYEFKEHKPWFDEECSKLLYQGKQAKMQ
jgi:hypothetical protein